jgi:hypothetical protein
MAIFKITSDKSRYANGFLDAAFGFDDPADDTLAADSLIVDANAFLVAEGVGGMGAFLNDTGAWNVTVNGTIFSKNHTGIILEFGAKTSSTITVGIEGEVGGVDGILVQNDVTIKNSGLISGTDIGVKIGDPGTHTITNNKTGTISGANYSIFDDFDTSDDKVTNAGQLIGDVDLGGGNDTMINSGVVDDDVLLGGGNNSLMNSGRIIRHVRAESGNDSITNSGRIEAESIGLSEVVALGEGNNTFTNSGFVGSGMVSVTGGSGNDKVTNSGTIGGSVSLLGGTNSVTNSGSMGNLSLGIGDDMVKNAGTTGSVTLGEGKNSLSNSGKGVIDGIVTSGAGDDTFVNSATISGNVELGDGTNKLTNSGTIVLRILTGDGNDTVTNSGKVLGNGVAVGNGSNTILNSGTIVGLVEGGTGADTLTNSGTIKDAILLGDGNDIMKNTGTAERSILLGKGDDSFTGGNKVEFVFDEEGNDIYKFGGGNDFFGAANPGPGTDTVDGGTGIDTYDAASANSTVTINLDSVDHAIPEFGFGTIATNTATGTDIGGTDMIKNFENAIGGDIGDTLYGSAAANRLDGNLGGDSIAGFGGNDVIDGGGDGDNISGGTGADSLTGGGGADNFLYAALNESGLSKAKRDTIFDFGVGGTDTIWLNPIDANTKNGSAVNDPFSWIGTNVPFSGAAGELRAYWTVNGQIVDGDVNGDKKADFSIEIVDPGHSIVLAATDFIL